MWMYNLKIINDSIVIPEWLLPSPISLTAVSEVTLLILMIAFTKYKVIVGYNYYVPKIYILLCIFMDFIGITLVNKFI